MIQLTLVGAAGRHRVSFRPKVLLCAGFAGRNQEKVRAHIEELAEMGVTPPAQTPTVYRCPPSLLTTAREVDVAGGKTSGEVECVILWDHGSTYVTVGSDHTDRSLEAVDIRKSKLVCPKIMAPEVWSYNDLDHWDALELTSRVPGRTGMRAYQDGKLSEVMRPLGLMPTLGAIDDGTVLFSGTIPLSGKVAFSDRFEMTMTDPILRRRISHGYSVRVTGTGAD